MITLNMNHKIVLLLVPFVLAALNVLYLIDNQKPTALKQSVARNSSGSLLTSSSDYPHRELDITCRENDTKRRNVPFTPREAAMILHWYKSVDDYFSPNRTDPINLPEDEGDNLFQNYDVSHNSSVHRLEDAKSDYFYFSGKNIACYKRGTEKMKNETDGNRTCVCFPSFTGKYCSVPKTVDVALKKLKKKYVFTPRMVPRRIIFALTFNMEHVVLFLKMLQTAPAVDLFLILEGNVTNYGDPKPLYLLPALKRGFLRRWHGKIMHMFNGEFVPTARKYGEGFDQERHIRSLFGPAIKERVKNVRDDDLFMYFDADETPGLDELLFLKLHDGFPVPVGFFMQLFRYGLYWFDQKVKWPAMGVSTVKMFYDVYSGNSNILRGHIYNDRYNMGIKNFGGDRLHDVWFMGSAELHAGWHLSYFGTPGQVYVKIMSTINADWPRWADNPKNRNITYILSLFRRGRFFHLKHDFVPVCPNTNPTFKDLSYIFKHPKYFNYLLVNPSRIVTS